MIRRFQAQRKHIPGYYSYIATKGIRVGSPASLTPRMQDADGDNS